MCCNVTNFCFSILIAAHNFILSIIDAVINSIRILRSLILWFLLHTFVSSIAATSQHCNLRAHSKLINSYFLCSQLYFRNSSHTKVLNLHSANLAACTFALNRGSPWQNDKLNNGV